MALAQSIVGSGNAIAGKNNSDDTPLPLAIRLNLDEEIRYCHIPHMPTHTICVEDSCLPGRPIQDLDLCMRFHAGGL